MLDSIPSSSDVGIASTQFSADDDNKRKLKAVYTSCLDVERLNERGLDPLLPLVKTITDIAGSFTDLPPPEKEENGEADFMLYAVEVPEHVRAAGIKAQEAMKRKDAAWPVSKQAEVELEKAKKHERAGQLTKALAWLHSRGELNTPGSQCTMSNHARV